MDTNSILFVASAGLAALLLARRLGAKKDSPALVLEKIRAGARVVDVRTPGEYSSGSYPRARNIPIDSLFDRMAELPKDKPIVLYCASGARSARAARMLRKAGFPDVLSAGGLEDMPGR